MATRSGLSGCWRRERQTLPGSSAPCAYQNAGGRDPLIGVRICGSADDDYVPLLESGPAQRDFVGRKQGAFFPPRAGFWASVSRINSNRTAAGARQSEVHLHRIMAYALFHYCWSAGLISQALHSDQRGGEPHCRGLAHRLPST